MRRLWVFAAMVAVVSSAFGDPSGDRPDARHAWAVHDVNRPDPAPVSAPPDRPPSDALVLFDGTPESVARNWRGRKGRPVGWKVENGAFVSVPHSGSIETKQSFADFQLHVEWKIPTSGLKELGNSGITLMGQYEVQILDSFGITPSRSPWKEGNCSDGQAGAVYGQHPGLVNPSRRPGEWQTFDIVFHPPVWDKDGLSDPGSITLLYNGVLVQDAWPMEGATCWCRRPIMVRNVSEGPLIFQEHGDSVSFRNIWIRRIPSRFADTTGGGPGVKESDVAALRAKLAAESRAAAESCKDLDERVVRLWESFCYKADAVVLAAAQEASRQYAKTIDSWSPEKCAREFQRLAVLRRFADMLVSEGYLPKDAALKKSTDAAIGRRKR